MGPVAPVPDPTILLDTDPDWIATKRFHHSLQELLARYPDGCSDRIIGTALGIPENEVEVRYQLILTALRGFMGVSSDEE